MTVDEDLLNGIQMGDVRAVSRAISLIINGSAEPG